MVQAAARAALARSGAWAAVALPESPASSATSGSMSGSVITGSGSRGGSGVTGGSPLGGPLGALPNGGSAAAEALAALADMTPGLGPGQGFGLAPKSMPSQGLLPPDRREVVSRSAIRAVLSSQGVSAGSQAAVPTEPGALGRLQAHGGAAAAAASAQGGAPQQAPVPAQQAAGAPGAQQPIRGLPLQAQAPAAAPVLAPQAPAPAAPGGFAAAAAGGGAAAPMEAKVEAALTREAAGSAGAGPGLLPSAADADAEAVGREATLGGAALPAVRAWRGGPGFMASQVLALEAALAGLDRQIMEQLMTRQAGDGSPAQPSLEKKVRPWSHVCNRIFARISLCLCHSKRLYDSESACGIQCCLARQSAC